MTQKPITSTCFAGCKKNNEVSGHNLLRSDVPKNAQDFTYFSSASLNRSTQTSTPCAIFAKSRFSTFSLRKSMISGGNVMVIDTRFRAMHSNHLHTMLNMCNFNMCDAHSKCAGTSIYGRNQANRRSLRPQTNNLQNIWKFSINRGENFGWKGIVDNDSDNIRSVADRRRLHNGKSRRCVQRLLRKSGTSVLNFGVFNMKISIGQHIRNQSIASSTIRLWPNSTPVAGCIIRPEVC